MTAAPLPVPTAFGRLTGRLVAACLVLLAVAIGFGTPRAAAQDDYLSGQFLVAEPGMPDPRFAEAVILMISHDAGGALGLIVNHRIAMVDIADLLEEFGRPSEGAEGTIGLHYGGPVQPERGFILHSPDHVSDTSDPVGGDFAVTGQPDILESIAGGAGPKESLFVLGYAGWGPGQLESELERDTWFTAPADPELVFTDDPATTWQQVMDRRAVDL